MDKLINKITELEVKCMVYSENLGPNSPEVNELDREIARLNAEIMELMMETPWKRVFITVYHIYINNQYKKNILQLKYFRITIPITEKQYEIFNTIIFDYRMR